MMTSDYPEEMVWRANLAAMFCGGSREDCLSDIYVYVMCDNMTIEKAYAKTCYKNSQAGMQGRHGDANLIVNQTDYNENYVFEEASHQESIDTLIDLKGVELDSTEQLILYLLANKETGTAISKHLSCSVKTAIRKIKKLRTKLERAML